MNPSFCGTSSTKQLHVLMFPWLAHGHFSAFAELSKRIAEKGIQVSFLTTPLNIPRVKSMLSNHENIQLLQLPFPAVEGLPKGIQFTADTPPHLWPLLLRAMHLAEKSFEGLLHNINVPPDCIVFDLVQYWTPKIAAKFGIPTVLFFTFGATFCSYEFSPHRSKCQEKITVHNLSQPPPGFPSSVISQRHFEACFSLNRFYVKDDCGNGTRGIDRVMQCIEDCNAIAIKSCSELEGKFIEYFERVIMKPVLPVGPLILPGSSGPQGDSQCCMEWLRMQQASSVVYACFGSQGFLSEDQIHEVALGLEAAQQPFILVLGLQDHFAHSEVFERRIGKSGLVLTGWAPQREILCHPSTGAFVTHCGWNSVMEGLSSGVPFIALPMQGEQGINARLIVEELKVGMEVEREEDGFANKDQICKAVRRMMEDEEGNEIKKRACKMGNWFRSNIIIESQKTCIDKFVEHLVDLVLDKDKITEQCKN